MAADYSNISFADDGRLKLQIIVGTRPEVIRLSEVIKKCRSHFDCLLAHTGQNYDYELNQVFFEDLGLRAPDYYLNAAGANLGETIGAIIAKSITVSDIQQITGNTIHRTHFPSILIKIDGQIDNSAIARFLINDHILDTMLVVMNPNGNSHHSKTASARPRREWT